MLKVRSPMAPSLLRAGRTAWASRRPTRPGHDAARLPWPSAATGRWEPLHPIANLGPERTPGRRGSVRLQVEAGFPGNGVRQEFRRLREGRPRLLMPGGWAATTDIHDPLRLMQLPLRCYLPLHL